MDALNKLSSLYESESERDERIRATQRERDAMEGLGLADAFKTAVQLDAMMDFMKARSKSTLVSCVLFFLFATC